MNAIYLVTDDRLAAIAGVQAQRIARQWQCDVHIFVERADPSRPVHECSGAERVFYHYDRLAALLPQGLPEDRKWPKIVYMRLFVPALLSQYRRLLYLDADILSMRAEPALWEVDLPSGLGAVSDIATLTKAPYDQKGMSRDDWLASIGVSSGRYLNSGVLLIDPARFLRVDCAGALQEYFRRFPAAARFDQDFLNHVFDGTWTELSPRMNYQAYVLELGLTRAVAPVFVHFCRTQKPWHGDNSGWRAPTDPRYHSLYRGLILAEGLDPGGYERPSRVSALRRMKYALRVRLRRLGIVSGREKRDLAAWHARAESFERFMTEGLAAGRFADESRRVLDAPRCAAIHDGRYAVGMENRQADNGTPGN